jgi:hypothetical protein
MAINENKFNKKVNELIDGYSKQYKAKANEYARELLFALLNGQDIDKAIKYAESKVKLLPEMDIILLDQMLQAVAAGYGIQPKIVVDPKSVKRSFLNESWTHDNMKLSTRLHTSSIKMRTNIIDTVKAAMRVADSFVEMARKLYTGYGKGSVINQAELPKYLQRLAYNAQKVAGGDVLAYKEFQSSLDSAKRQISRLSSNGAPTKALKAAYTELVNAAEKLSTKGIERAVNTAIQERSRYYSERIARTEIARAFAEGVIAKVKDDPDVVGFKWTLGSRHPRYDICDFHAKANLYGMGAGIYPKDKFPQMPAHPHCHCYPREVTIGSADRDHGKYDNSAGRKHLEKLTDSQLQELMGIEGVKAFRKGANWESLLRSYDPTPMKPPRISQDVMEGKE